MDVLVVFAQELGIALLYLLEEPSDLVQKLRKGCRVSNVSERIVKRDHIGVKSTRAFVFSQDVHLLKQTHHLAVQIIGPAEQRSG